MTTRRGLAALLMPLLLLTTACSGGDKDSGSDETPEQVLAGAKQELDETSGITLLLETPELPSGVTGVVKAEGVATHQPGFEGTIDVVYSGITANVKVKAVDGKVYAVLPFTKSYNELDPEEYNAPDPAGLMDPEGGVSSWLTAATDVKEGKSVRDGGEVLTSYTGTLPGSAVVSAIPSADESADFEATFTIDSDGRLRVASVTGPFYAGEPELTYDITITDYGTEKEITAP